MNERFRAHVESLQPKFEALMQMRPVTVGTVPRDMPRTGIYLFSEGDNHLYVGRSKRLRDRLKYHCGTATDAPFAFKLARHDTGNVTASYSKAGGRKELLGTAEFAAAFQRAKDRIRRMDLRFVEEPDPDRQALLEIYATIALKAPYNDFDTH
jgi:hypothetical protein